MGLNRTGHGEGTDVVLALQSDRTVYRVGQPVVFTLTVTTKGDRPVQLMFPSAQVYDVVVRQESREVWRWSREQMFAMVLTEVLLLPGQPQSYSVSWEQIDAKGRLVPPGEYEVVGLLVGPQPAFSPSLRMTIQ